MTIDTRMLGTPVDRVSARVMSKGESHHWGVNRKSRMWIIPPETIDPPTDSDLSGEAFGRMTAIAPIKRKPSRWLCRCACGIYEQRNAKAILNPRNNKDACVNCRTLIERQRHSVRVAYYEKHGVWPEESTGADAVRIIKEWSGRR